MGVSNIEHIPQFGTRSGIIQKRDAFCATPDIPPHGVRPQLKRRAGGRVRALGVDQNLIIKGTFVVIAGRAEKACPALIAAGDALHSLVI